MAKFTSIPVGFTRGTGTLGTFVSVFTPSIHTILGIILFRRMGYVVGNAGLGDALVILCLANLISVLTSLSLSAIATNLRVKGGGDYYIISRTLGVEFGGAIVIVLFLAQSVSIAFYCIGFGEVAALMLPYDHPVLARTIAAVAIGLLFVFAWLGTDWARFLHVVLNRSSKTEAIFTTGDKAVIVSVMGTTKSPPESLQLHLKKARTDRRITGRAILQFILVLWTVSVAAQGSSIPQKPQPTEPPSVIEIPIQLSLAPMFRTVEKTVPRQTGNWPGWRDWHGVKTQYRAWRGPLSIHMSGETLLVQAHVRYWIKAHAKVLKLIKFDAQCGVQEPPRQAIMGVLVRFRWAPDWTLRPDFQILPTRFLDRCEMTVANIDVTPLVEKEFRQKLKSSLRSAIQTLAPRLFSIRGQADRAWTTLEEPMEIEPGNWLLLRPSGIAFSPFYGHADTIRAHLAIMMHPKLALGARPVTQKRPLPPLWQYHPRKPGLNFRLKLNLSFSDLSREVSRSLLERTFNIEGRKIAIESFEMKRETQTISARVRLGGDAVGTAEVWTNVVFSPEKQRLHLKNLEYIFEPEDPSLAMLADLFYEKIRQALQDAANEMLNQRLQRWTERLTSVIDNALSADARFDFSSLRLQSAQVLIDSNGIRLEGLATGGIKLKDID